MTGRGRGRGWATWNTGQSGDSSPVVDKFSQIQKENREKALHFANNQAVDDSSSSEDEVEQKTDIIGKVVCNYSGDKVDIKGFSRTEQYLNDAFSHGANVCLICIENIKRTIAIWDCNSCFAIFHLSCIQKWAKDSVFQQSQAMEMNGTNVSLKKMKQLPWCCPKCRFEYAQEDTPSTYYCYCRKEQNPIFDQWLVPHSCGANCLKELTPNCGHKCFLLCHPGPCPPCPQMVRQECYCGKGGVTSKRCLDRYWSCGKSCGLVLSCGQHKCEQKCHPGDCQPCPRQSNQKCVCGQQYLLRPCSDPVWQCEGVCGKPFACGFHTCDKVCHPPGLCGDCPLTGNRFCPCGKAELKGLSCTESSPSCGDTCGMLLECGAHTCEARCHSGPCGMCMQMSTKRCRCGLRERSMQCYKEYFCESKCKKTRDCGRHACNRKCCDGQCPPCEQPCTRTLSCHSHKCASRCHPGPCYPCSVVVKVYCFCKDTFVSVPCGRERRTKPPKCKQLCRIKPDCHHAERVAHRCHFESCPACVQICDRKLGSCDHSCPASCHTAVLVKIESKQKRAGPWEPIIAPLFEVRALPCPPCLVPVPVMCLGDHGLQMFPCSEQRPFSCGKMCGVKLACGNHSCQMECHKSMTKPCVPCEEACLKPRAQGCSHKCEKGCHPEPCDPCKQKIKLKCNCGINFVYINCDLWCAADEPQKVAFKGCRGPCPKILLCGHPCVRECHDGPCAQDEFVCKRKQTVRCPCKRIKKTLSCHVTADKKNAPIQCDEECKRLEQAGREAMKQEADRLNREAAEKERAELEKFERKMAGNKRRKQRKQKEEESATPWYLNQVLLSAVTLAGIAAFAGFLFYRNWKEGGIGEASEDF